MLNKPITQRVKDKFAELTQEPLLNVGKVSGGNSKSCGCPSGCNCGSPAKMYGKSPSKKALVGNQKNLPKEIKDKILAAPGKYGKSMAKKKGCGSPAKIAPLAAIAVKAAVPALIGGLFGKKK